MTSPSRTQRVVALAMAMSGLAASCGLQQASDSANPTPTTVAVGQPVPNYTGTDLDGKSISLKDFRGHAVLLNFWASWCGPCGDEQPGLNKIARDYDAKGLRVVGVANWDNLKDAREFRDLFHVTDPSYFDPDARLGRAFQVASPPASVLIDADGNVRDIEYGGFSEKAMRGLLADKLHL